MLDMGFIHSLRKIAKYIPQHRQTLLVYARYDLTVPVDLSRDLVRQFERQGIPHEVAVLRCGHYTTGVTPFKFVDGLILSRFLKRALLAD